LANGEGEIPFTTIRRASFDHIQPVPGGQRIPEALKHVPASLEIVDVLWYLLCKASGAVEWVTNMVTYNHVALQVYEVLKVQEKNTANLGANMLLLIALTAIRVTSFY
jgi:hypothetical protein